ncbi:hypothetical protein DSECCO2_533440 [anaerobic digester metagenome]
MSKSKRRYLKRVIICLGIEDHVDPCEKLTRFTVGASLIFEMSFFLATRNNCADVSAERVSVADAPIVARLAFQDPITQKSGYLGAQKHCHYRRIFVDRGHRKVLAQFGNVIHLDHRPQISKSILSTSCSTSCLPRCCG